MPVKKHTLTDRQKLFVGEYLSDPKLNATQAAIRAGFSEKKATQTAFRLMNLPQVKAHIQREMDKRAMRTSITADDVLRDLREIADKCMGKLETVTVSDGVEARTKQFDATPAIKSLELLGKHLKMFTDKQEITGANGEAIQVDNNWNITVVRPGKKK